MTIETAIKTIEAAIAEVEWEYPMDYAVAFEMAIAALRAQAEAENEPLTVEELRKMDGEPVWCTENGSACPAQSWGIVSNLNDILPGSGFCIIGAQFAFLQDKYGETWLAYRRKPEEGPT